MPSLHYSEKVEKNVLRNAFHLPPYPCLLFIHLSDDLSEALGHQEPHTDG